MNIYRPMAVLAVAVTTALVGCKWGDDPSDDDTTSKSVVRNSVVDERDGTTYETITLKTGTTTGLTWMAENLNFATDSSWCYNNSPDSCAKYGRLYTWNTAKSACAGMGSRWRLPTREDWSALVSYAGDDAGKTLKSTSGWEDNGNGTDDYGFTSLPGGYYNTNSDSFNSVGSYGYWWSSSEQLGSSGILYARYRVFSSDNDGYIFDQLIAPNSGYSVRCVAPN